MTLGSLTLADLSILGAFVLALAPIAVAKYGDMKSFDNSKPRDDKFYTDPFRARALGAHKNGLENFPLFAAAVILAELRDAPQMRVDGLALAYLLLRVAYIALYLGNVPPFRSAVWALGLAVNVAIFLAPVWAR